MTGSKPLPKRALHIVRSRASSFKWEYPLLSLRPSSSFLRLLPRLPVSSIPLFIFPLITRCGRQFLRKMWPIQFAFYLSTVHLYLRHDFYKTTFKIKHKLRLNLRISHLTPPKTNSGCACVPIDRYLCNVPAEYIRILYQIT